jgi:hypothetical protein
VVKLYETYQTSSGNPYLIRSSSKDFFHERPSNEMDSLTKVLTFKFILSHINGSRRRYNIAGIIQYHCRSISVADKTFSKTQNNRQKPKISFLQTAFLCSSTSHIMAR